MKRLESASLIWEREPYKSSGAGSCQDTRRAVSTFCSSFPLVLQMIGERPRAVPNMIIGLNSVLIAVIANIAFGACIVPIVPVYYLLDWTTGQCMWWQAWEKGGNEPPQVKDGQVLCPTQIDNVIRFENSLHTRLLLDRIGAKPKMRPREKFCLRIINLIQQPWSSS